MAPMGGVATTQEIMSSVRGSSPSSLLLPAGHAGDGRGGPGSDQADTEVGEGDEDGDQDLQD